MKQTSIMIKLKTLANSSHPWGTDKGKAVFRALSELVDRHPSQRVFEVSFEGIEITDVSFARESLVALAKQLRGEKAFYLSKMTDNDLILNWNAAALLKDQPLILWLDGTHKVIGPEMTSDAQQLLDFVCTQGNTSTAEVSEHFGITVQNASTKLKNLYKQGVIIRSERAAETGGREYAYAAVK